MASSEAAVKAAWKLLDDDRNYATELTQKLVRIPSVNSKFIKDPDQNFRAAQEPGRRQGAQMMSKLRRKQHIGDAPWPAPIAGDRVNDISARWAFWNCGGLCSRLA
jgi:hypothetical protein